MRFHNNDPRLAWFGIVPPGLKGALIEVGVDQRDLQDCIQEIMSAITNNLIDRWKKRCRYLLLILVSCIGDLFFIVLQGLCKVFESKDEGITSKCGIFVKLK